jgi:protocatechuate 4,5-dioxygenase, alpha chain
MNDSGRPMAELLTPPNAYLFSIRQCARAFRLNQFAIGLKAPANREIFVADERAAMEASGLSESEMKMVEARDWTGLIAHGGHVLAVVKIAYSLGILHHEVCAHMCGMTYAELKPQLPRESALLPLDPGHAPGHAPGHEPDPEPVGTGR